MQTNIIDDTIPNIPQRIHIAPVGFEVDRIVLPVLGMRAEKVILIANEPSQDKAKKFYADVQKRLTEEKVDFEIVRTPFFSLKDNINLFTDLIIKNKEQQLWINISSGSKIQALAAFIAVMAAKSQEINVATYYVEPEKYTEDPPENPISSGCKKVHELPIFPLHTPPKEIQQSVVLLTERPYYKLELAIKLAKANIFNKDLLNLENGKPKNDKARVTLQNMVENRVIQPMLRERYATSEKIGRNIRITITDFGRDASNLFLSFK